MKQYKGQPKESLGYGISAIFASFVFAGVLAIYYLAFLYKPIPLVAAIILWAVFGIFAFGGIYLFFMGIVVIIQNLIFYNEEDFVSDKDDEKPHLLTGLFAFLIGTILTLVIVLYLHPEYQKGECDPIMFWGFTVMAAIFLLGAFFVFFANIFKRN